MEGVVQEPLLSPFTVSDFFLGFLVEANDLLFTIMPDPVPVTDEDDDQGAGD
jgi:hypothetical protein